MDCDVIIVGGGPAGLAAAINASAEGLSTILICERLGGQAGTSSLIENYPGFPDGISGPELTERNTQQAEKFGTVIRECGCDRLERIEGGYRCHSSTGDTIDAPVVIIASGARYRRLNPETGFEAFEGRGVHYEAMQESVAASCKCDEVVVVGGANSAGQAATYLADRSKRVHLVVRGASIDNSMSGYLLERVKAHPHITIHFNSEVDAIDGEEWVDMVLLKDRETGTLSVLEASDVFVMIGAQPNASFADTLDCTNDKGFIPTDDFFRTELPGLFAVGDIRADNVKRVANAVGEGSTVIKWVWRYLKEELPAQLAGRAVPA
jgi:thioredoxin reductase (NADPH)